MESNGAADAVFGSVLAPKPDGALISDRRPSTLQRRVRNSIKIWRTDDLPGVQVHWFTESTRSLRFYSETYDMVLVREGTSVILSGGKELASAPGTVMVLEPRTVFSHVSIPMPETVQILHIAPAVVDEARPQLGPNARRHEGSAVLRNPPIHEALVQLHTALASDATPLDRQVLFSSLVRSFFEDRLLRAITVEPRAVQRVRDILHAHFREPTPLTQLSRESGMSPFYLSRCFRRAFGVAPHTYQTLLRVANARDLLVRGVPPSEAAVASGFCDQSHLTRQFRRAFGLTPSRYARDARVSMSFGRP